MSYVIYEIIKYWVFKSGSPMIEAVSEATILNLISYGIIAFCGFRLYHAADKNLLGWIVLLLIAVLALSLSNHSFNPNSFKYPPGLLYVLWGLFVVAISFFILRFLRIVKLPCLLKFISANSLWIYFWHALFLTIEKYYFSIENWVLHWCVLVLFSLSMSYFQNLIRGKIRDTGIMKLNFNKL